MLAARDQENLVHARQTAGASKPLNQGIRQFPPKTPNAKVPKTPFKVPLNDENAIGGGKFTIKGNGKVDENQMAGKKLGLGNSNAFVTPIGPRTRAPLGAKTTNAKARTFQVPADTVSKQPAANSVSARKPKSKPVKPETTRIEDILSIADDADFPEPEYMPPRSVPLPDYPDDAHLLDFSPISEEQMRADIARSVVEERGDDGLTRIEREELRSKRELDYQFGLSDLEAEHRRRGLEIPCIHVEDCEGICSVNGDKQDKADEWFRFEKEKLDEEYKDVVERQQKRKHERRERQEAQEKINKRNESGPNSLTCRATASALGQKPSIASPSGNDNKVSATSKPSLPSYMLPTRAKQQATAPPLSSAANTARHNTAVAASRTTMGYSKGRSTSAALRGTILPPPSTSITTKKMPLSNKTNTTRAPMKYSSTSSTSDKQPTLKPQARKSKFPSQNPIYLPNGEKADQSLPPSIYLQRYGKPPVGSKMWMRCFETGTFDEEPDLGDGGYVFGEGGGELEPWEVEGALDDFQLDMPGV